MGSYRIVVAGPGASREPELIQALQGHHVVPVEGFGPGVQAAIQQERPDLVILEGDAPGGQEEAKRLALDGATAVVMLTAECSPPLLHELAAAGVAGCLARPVHGDQVRAVVEIAVHRFRELAALRGDLKEFADKVETRRLIDQAKALLMGNYGISEPEAFRRLQLQSMNSRRSMKEIAQVVLRTGRI